MKAFSFSRLENHMGILEAWPFPRNDIEKVNCIDEVSQSGKTDSLKYSYIMVSGNYIGQVQSCYRFVEKCSQNWVNILY